MADPQTVPSDTDAYNAGYNQPNDPHIITAWNYDPPPEYEQLQRGTQPQNVDQQLQSGKQYQNPDQHTQNYRQQPPIYGQLPQNDGNQTQNYGQQSQTYGQQPHTYGRQQQPYVQQPQVYGQGQLNMGQETTIEQPIQATTSVNVTQVNSSTGILILGRGRPDQTMMAIYVCLCCFFPTGIAAIIYAQKATEAYQDFNYEEGNRYHTTARRLIFISMAAFFVFFIVALIFGLIAITIMKAKE